MIDKSKRFNTEYGKMAKKNGCVFVSNKHLVSGIDGIQEYEIKELLLQFVANISVLGSFIKIKAKSKFFLAFGLFLWLFYPKKYLQQILVSIATAKWFKFFF